MLGVAVVLEVVATLEVVVEVEAVDAGAVRTGVLRGLELVEFNSSAVGWPGSVPSVGAAPVGGGGAGTVRRAIRTYQSPVY